MRARTGVLAAVVVSALVACSGGSTSPPNPDAALVKTSADRIACQHVQRVFLALAEVSARWDSKGKPFDASVARQLNPYNHELRLEARAAETAQLRIVIERNADALGNLTQAMLSRRQVRVNAAIAESRRAYAALPACAHRDGKRSLPLTSPSVSPGAEDSATAIPTAVDPVCPRVKSTFDRLSPVTAKWNMDKVPFDAKTAAAFRGTATGLRAAAVKAQQTDVRTTLEANARAFDHLAAVMAAHRKGAVRQALIDVQQSAADLAGLCPL